MKEAMHSFQSHMECIVGKTDGFRNPASASPHSNNSVGNLEVCPKCGRRVRMFGYFSASGTLLIRLLPSNLVRERQHNSINQRGLVQPMIYFSSESGALQRSLTNR